MNRKNPFGYVKLKCYYECYNSTGEKMLKVKVKYFTTLCELAGRTEEELMMNDCATLIDLIKIIVSKYGREAYDYLYEKRTGKVDPSIYFLINGKDSWILSGLNTKLKNGDIIAIIPPIGGGG